MTSNPFLGILLHALGGLAAASFYLPLNRVKGWQWESLWLISGFFSWLVAPLVAGLLICPNLLEVFLETPPQQLIWTWIFGALWGVGGLTFGLSVRFLGQSLGYALSLGFCAACGTVIPPIFMGEAGGADRDDLRAGHPWRGWRFACWASPSAAWRGSSRKTSFPRKRRKRRSRNSIL